MRKFTLITILSIFFLGLGQMNAQIAVAHVNSNEILEALPEYKAAQEKLEAETARHKTEVERQQAEMKTIYDSATEKMKSVENKSEAEQRAMLESLAPVQEDLQKKQQALTAYQQNAASELQKMEADLIKPIYTKVETAIQVVGNNKKVGYIFDLATAAASGNLVYFQGGTDLTAEVKAQLGL